jgi:hypothetical protein
MSKPSHFDDFRSRARRTLFWCALLLFVSPVPGGWLIDHCPVHIRFPEMAATVSSWQKANPNPNILILGSSRLGSFVRNAELAAMTTELVGNDSALFFNSTIPGGDPITLQFLTRQLLACQSAPPRLVVLETNVDLLARDNLYFKGVVTQVMTAADIPKYLGDILLYHDGVSRLLSSRLTPFFRHRSHLLAWADEALSGMFAQNKSAVDETQQLLDRWRNFANDKPDALPPAERLRIALRRFEIHLRHYQLAGATPAAFESTVAMLHARGCAIALVEPPLSSAHRAFFSTAMQTQFEAFVRRLHDSYGCQFFDYSDRLPDTYFSDNHHANAEGSLRFTELLAQEVVAPEWRNLEAKKGE